VQDGAMATALQKLTIEQFNLQYGDRKPYHEYWYGEAIPKAMPTLIHALLQKILLILFDEIGYTSVAEVRLRLDPDVEPLPDVIAISGPVGLPYPTKPFDVAVEILSPEDSFQRITKKCRLYHKWGIRHILVVDGEERIVWKLEPDGNELHEISEILFSNGRKLLTQQLWEELDRRLMLIS
jgi:Uma2 family endonuclease